VTREEINPPSAAGARELEGAEREELDPELLDLPDPPKKERTLTVALMAVTALASIAMIAALARDAMYAFASPSAVDLGDLRTAPASALADNTLVRASGMLGAAGALRYERPFDHDTYRVSPVAGRPDIWVEVRVPAREENARYVPPTSFAGRLVKFEHAGQRHRGLRGSIETATGRAVPPGAWLLVDGESPSHARWAVALMALFAAFAVWNVANIARLLRKVKE
jgi:hypothetical protein